MTKAELDHMKSVPGLYLVSGGVLIASVDGKLHALRPDQVLSDGGWPDAAHMIRCLLVGPVGRLGE